MVSSPKTFFLFCNVLRTSSSQASMLEAHFRASRVVRRRGGGGWSVVGGGGRWWSVVVMINYGPNTFVRARAKSSLKIKNKKQETRNQKLLDPPPTLFHKTQFFTVEYIPLFLCTLCMYIQYLTLQPASANFCEYQQQ